MKIHSFVDTLKRSLVFSKLRRISKQQQCDSELRDLSLWGLKVNHLGHIAVGDVDLTDLAGKFGSPLMVVNAMRLKEDANAMVSAMDTAPAGSRVFYSYKTNCTPGVLAKLHNMGIGAEVISPYELWLAEKLGVPGDLILYNGVDKTPESIELAARLNILAINVDHVEEIEKIYAVAKKLRCKVRVGVRLGLVDASQFGLSIDNGEAMEACRKIVALSDHLDLRCVHFNVTDNARSVKLHKACALKAVEFMSEVSNSTGHNIEYLDIGGGYGVPTTKHMSPVEYGLYRLVGNLPKPPAIKDFQPIHAFFREILTSIKNASDAHGISMPKVLVEPGRFITSRAQLLLTRVKTIKKRPNGIWFAITDAGRFSVTRPCEFEYHEVFVASRPAAPLQHPYHVMGRVCSPADWLFKNRYLPTLSPGDTLAVMDAGAYFSSFSTNFAFPRPAIVMVDGSQSILIKKEESFDHLVAMDTF